MSKARMTASKSPAIEKVAKRAEEVPTAIREEFKFMIPDDKKELKARVAEYVKKGELTVWCPVALNHLGIVYLEFLTDTIRREGVPWTDMCRSTTV